MVDNRNNDDPPALSADILGDRQRYKLRYRTTLPSTRPAINRAVREVLKVADEVGFSEDGRADLEIALREAVANAIIHGNRNRRNKRVLLRCYGVPDGALLIAVRDEGEGFDPEGVPDPRSAERVFLHHGRGIFLMRELMDHVAHRKGGREVVLFKSAVTNDEGEGEKEDEQG